MKSAPPRGPIPVGDDDLARCVACGLCLPHCPTWRVSGEERASPRGRIVAMRAVQWTGAAVDSEFSRMMTECVQCRGCEPVCPAFVPFGRLMEGARSALQDAEGVEGGRVRRGIERIAYGWVLPRHAVLMAVTWLMWLVQKLRLLPAAVFPIRLRAADLARPVRSSAGEGEAVFLFPGCVMDAWMRPTHRAAVSVVEAAGGRVELPGPGADCCGALHLHAGRSADARRLAERVIGSMPPDAPVLVDSAGCGAAMKEYGRLLGTDEAHAFASRVADVNEWLDGREPSALRHSGLDVLVQDPCHLRNAQQRHESVRRLLGRAYGLLETDDDGVCCGAGGMYSVTEREWALRIRSRKIEAIRRAAGPRAIVASANPGCIVHLRAGGVDARHPVELLADAMPGGRPGRPG